VETPVATHPLKPTGGAALIVALRGQFGDGLVAACAAGPDDVEDLVRHGARVRLRGVGDGPRLVEVDRVAPLASSRPRIVGGLEDAEDRSGLSTGDLWW
jgi:hypothetical protein